MQAEKENGFMRCELKLDTSSKGWHKTMIKVLHSIKGVNYYIDTEAGIAYVSGLIHPETLLRVLAKAGKHAKLLKVDSGYRKLQPFHEKSGFGSSSSSHGYDSGYNTNKSTLDGYGPYGQYDCSYGQLSRPLQIKGDPVRQSAMANHRFYDADTQCTIM